jgi:hypothetical protein
MNEEFGFIAGIFLIVFALVGLAFWGFLVWCNWYYDPDRQRRRDARDKEVRQNWPEVKK